MKSFRAAFVLAALLLSAPVYANISDDVGEITQLLLDKSDRTLYLLHGTRAVRQYRVDLGPSPEGHKAFQGDGRTPEGLYYITHRNPNSSYFLSLGISYPNADDRANARLIGRDPGGDIFIHGRGRRGDNPPADWTEGCAAVSDLEMAEIYNLVQPGTPIFIKP